MTYGSGLVKAQSAVEYLTTYGWVVLIIAVAIGSLYLLGVFGNSNYAPSECAISNIGCVSKVMSTSGMLEVNLANTQLRPINITAIGCNENGTESNLHTLSNSIVIEPESNATFFVQCYADNGSKFSGDVGGNFNGYLLIKYAGSHTGLQNTVSGKLSSRITLLKNTNLTFSETGLPNGIYWTVQINKSSSFLSNNTMTNVNYTREDAIAPNSIIFNNLSTSQVYNYSIFNTSYYNSSYSYAPGVDYSPSPASGNTAYFTSSINTVFSPYAYFTGAGNGALSLGNGWIYAADYGITRINTSTGFAKEFIVPNAGQEYLGIALNPSGTLMYALDNRGTSGTVSVYNAISGAFVTNISLTCGSDNTATLGGVAIAPSGAYGYAVCDYADFNATSYDVFNTTTDTVVGKFSGIGNFNTELNGVVFNPAGTYAYIAETGLNSVAKIDTATNTLVGNIIGFNAPINLAITSDGSELYVTNSNQTVSIYGINTGNVISVVHVPFAKGTGWLGAPIALVPGSDSSYYLGNNYNMNGGILLPSYVAAKFS